jgi:hypothetical protein
MAFMLLKNRQQPVSLREVVGFQYLIVQVRTVKAGDEFPGLFEFQLLDDVVAHAMCRAGGECRDRLARKFFLKHFQFAVVGAKFVPPFRNAMRFVDHKKRDRHFLQPVNHFAFGQPFRRKIQQPKLTTFRAVLRLTLLVPALAAVQHRSGNPHLLELRDLILHQRNQGRNHNRGLLCLQRRRQLVAQRFAAACWHHHANIAPRQNVEHNRFLFRPKCVVAPIPLQCLFDFFWREHAALLCHGHGNKNCEPN